jgi:NAD(P)-dependent dehydrogenase (short-subunit alcohol dehydrogenase family)
VLNVLITGASRGIGFGLAREYLARGARVFAGVRDPDQAPALRTLPPDNLVVVRLDVRSQPDIQAAGELVASVAGGLDRLVNNAGILHPSDGFAEVDGERLREVLDVNVVGPLLVAQRFVPLLRPGGKLVNITMPSRALGDVSQARTNHAYIASRYAHNALTRMIAIELAGGDRTVVALWPGYLRTDMNNQAEEAAPLEEGIPGVVDLIERLGEADHGSCLMPDGSHFPW